MALTQRLEFRQTQSLVMTPQLMQAIKLLQLSNLDLVAFVEEELERNPLLERASDEGDPAERAEHSEPREGGEEGSFADDAGFSAQDGQDGASDFEGASEQWMDRDLGSRAEMEQTFDSGLENVFSEEPAEAASRAAQDVAPTSYTEWGGGASNDGDYNLESFVAAEATLGDHLAEQLSLAVTDPVRRLIGQYLIDLVDDAGYVPPDLSHVAEQLGASPADVEAVLAILQKFDPPGICARSLSECLAIQLRERDRYDPARCRLAAQDLRRRRRGSGRDDRRDPPARSKARLEILLGARADGRARCVRAAGTGRRMAGRAQQRHPAEGSRQPDLLQRTRRKFAQR
jgi:RNA polymerase sigma-54 factor